MPLIGWSVRRSLKSATVSVPPSRACARAGWMKGARRMNPAAARAQKWRRVRAAILSASGGFADVEDREHVDANHVQKIGDVDSLVRHRVVAAARAADDALHLRAMEEMGGVGAVEAGRRNGAG